jgi:pantothenate kinase
VVRTSLDDAVRDRLLRLVERGGRVLLGIVGPPGSGKSTLVEDLVTAAGVPAAVVPMDGFHLAQTELLRLGRSDRKGAADTFDAFGYLAMLRRLRLAGGDETVYAPVFRRDIEEPVAGAIPVAPDVRLVITEGNYLLRDEAPWNEVRATLDASWYLHVDDELRRQRLVERHQRFGADEAAARDWVMRVDEANARAIIADRRRADGELVWSSETARFGLAGH